MSDSEDSSSSADNSNSNNTEPVTQQVVQATVHNPQLEDVAPNRIMAAQATAASAAALNNTMASTSGAAARAETDVDDMILLDMLRKNNLDEITFADEPQGTATALPALINGNGEQLVAYDTTNHLEKLLVEQQAMLLAVASGNQDEIARVKDYMGNHTMTHTRSVLKAHEADQMNKIKRITAVSSYVRNRTDQDNAYVECPPLGGHTLAGKVRKDFRMSLYGISFSGLESDIDLPFNTMIQNVVSNIQEHGLNRVACYNLLRSCVKGPLLSYLNSSESSGVAFQAFFRSIQAMNQRFFSPEAIHAQLAKIRDTPPDDLNVTIAKVSALNEKLYGNLEPVEKLRRITASVRYDLMEIIKSYFPYLATSIEQKDRDLMKTYSLERRALEEAGQSIDQMQTFYHPISSLVCIILESTQGYKALDARSGPKRSTNAITAYDFTKEHSSHSRDRGRDGGDRRENVHAMSTANHRSGGNNWNSKDWSSSPRQDTDRSTGHDQPRSNTGNFQPRNDYQSNRNNYRSSNDYSNTDNSNNEPGRRDMTLAQSKPRFHCKLCGYDNHTYEHCRVYPDETPGDRSCQNCSGYHRGNCKRRNTFPQPQNRTVVHKEKNE